MKKNKSFLIFLLIILLLIGGVFAAYKRGLIKEEFLQKIGLKKETIDNFTKDADEQTQVVASKAKEVSEHATNVLESSIQVDEENQTPIHQKAFEYARYLYCQQAVSDYEERYKTN